VNHGRYLSLEDIFLLGEILLFDEYTLLRKVPVLCRDKEIDGKKGNQQYRNNRCQNNELGDIPLTKHAVPYPGYLYASSA
jgi:hypothetical protein